MRNWIEPVARLGYAARGAVYLTVGSFAILAAFGRSEAKGTKGALEALLAQPFGAVLVAVVSVGLVAIAGWRIVQAARDPDHHGSGAKGILIRVGLAAAGLSYLGLAVFAAAMLIGGRLGTGGDLSSGWLSILHRAGLQQLLAFLIAASMFIVGAAHMLRAIRASFEKYLQCPESTMRWLRPLSRAGLFARGAVFLVIGALMVRGGLTYRPEEQPGLADALRAVQAYAFGWLILLAIGFGLTAFGLYSMAEARFRRIGPAEAVANA